MRARDAALAFLPAALWAAAVWTVGGLQSVPAPPRFAGLDKVAHFGMYAVLGWLCGRGWVKVGGRRMLAALLIALTLALGAADELRQARTPNRSAERADWAADAAGVATGFYLAVLWARRRRKT